MRTALGEVLRLVVPHWVVGALLCAPLLLALTPLLARDWPAWLVLTWLQLPAYMLHQVEEHASDRFRHFVNARLADGQEALTPLAVAVINLPGVWGIDLLALLGAALVQPGLALVAVYLSLVNGLVHLVAAIAQRRANPGLVTAVALFLPLSALSLAVIGAEPSVGAAHHLVGVGIAVAIHAAIVVHVRRRVAA